MRAGSRAPAAQGWRQGDTDGRRDNPVCWWFCSACVRTKVSRRPGAGNPHNPDLPAA